MVALSVSTSTSGSPRKTRSPGFLSHASTVPSSIESLSRGIRTSTTFCDRVSGRSFIRLRLATEHDPEGGRVHVPVVVEAVRDGRLEGNRVARAEHEGLESHHHAESAAEDDSRALVPCDGPSHRPERTRFPASRPRAGTPHPGRCGPSAAPSERWSRARSRPARRLARRTDFERRPEQPDPRARRPRPLPFDGAGAASPSRKSSSRRDLQLADDRVQGANGRLDATGLDLRDEARRDLELSGERAKAQPSLDAGFPQALAERRRRSGLRRARLHAFGAPRAAASVHCDTAHELANSPCSYCSGNGADKRCSLDVSERLLDLGANGLELLVAQSVLLVQARRGDDERIALLPALELAFGPVLARDRCANGRRSDRSAPR